MPKLVYTNAYVSINSVVLSSRVRSISISQEWEDLDSSAMGDLVRQHEVGIGDDSFEVEFYQDFAAGSVDQTLSPLAGSNTGFPFELRPVNTTVSTTNPKYTGTAKLFTYQPIAGSHGQMAMTTVRFATLGITRGTS